MTLQDPSLPDIVETLEAVEWVGEERADDAVLIYVIHDGGKVPRSLFEKPGGPCCEEIFERPEIRRAYLLERDWGAHRVAAALARRLGLGGYLRVNLARVVMDYGRFPGDTQAKTPHLLRASFYPPISPLLSEQQKSDVLSEYYDPISRAIGERAIDKKVTIAIHTYDRFNASGTERPEVSLLSRLLEHGPESVLPPNVYDPLFPPSLCEVTTSHRSLIYQMLLNLERGGLQTALNYPYLMPSGATEIRGQVWFFFRHLRRHFLRIHPETRDQAAYRLVWEMLFDVDHRSANAFRLRGFLHHFYAPPSRRKRLFLNAREAYTHLREFLDGRREELVREYRHSPDRPSSLGIEVRKDILAEIDPDRLLARPRDDAEYRADDIARHISGAVLAFLDEEILLDELEGRLLAGRHGQARDIVLPG